MNAIKKIIFFCLMIFALAGCGNDTLNAEQSIQQLETAESLSSDQEIPSVSAYSSKVDLFNRVLIGYIFELKKYDWVLSYLGDDLSDYVSPIIPLETILTHWYIFTFFFLFGVLILVTAKEIINFLEDDKKLKEHKNHALWCGINYVAMSTFLSSFSVGCLILVNGFTNAWSANYSSYITNSYNNQRISSSDITSRKNEEADKLFSAKLEEKRTSMAKAARYATAILATSDDLGGLDRDSSVKEVASFFYSLSKLETATDKSSSVSWLDLLKPLTPPIYTLYRKFNDISVPVEIRFFTKKNDGGFRGLFIDDVLNKPSNPLSISMGSDISGDKLDFAAQGVDKSDRREFLAKMATDSKNLDPLATIESIKQIVLNSYKNGNSDFLSYDFDKMVVDKIRAGMTASFKTIETEIKSVNNESEKTELTRSAYAMLQANYKGLDNNSTIIKIYDSLDGAAVNWLKVNCVVNEKDYELYSQAYLKLQSFGGSFYQARNVWGDQKHQCILPVKNGFEFLVYNDVTQKAQIKSSYDDAKASREALNIYFNSVEKANQLALRESSRNLSNAQGKGMKNALLGWLASPSIIPTIATEKYASETSITTLNNALNITYANENESDNNYINEDSIFGDQTTDEHAMADSDKQELLKTFGPLMTAQLFNSNASISEGSIDAIKTQEESIQSDWKTRIEDAFIEEITGPIMDALKYVARTPSDKSLREGLAYCYSHSCSDVYSPSLYEATVVTGQRFTSAALTCIMTVKGVQVVNNAADVSEGLKAAPASVGKSGAMMKNSVGKLIKLVTGGAAVIASQYELPCQVLLAAGVTNGYIVPALLNISLLGIALVLVSTFVMLRFMWPISVGFDLILGGYKFQEKFCYRLLAVYISIPVILSGVFLMTAFASFPAYPFARLILTGLSSNTSIINLTVIAISLMIAFPVMLNWIFKIPEHTLDNFLEFLELSFNTHVDLNNNLANVVQGAAIASKFTAMAGATQRGIDATYKEAKDFVRHYEAAKNRDVVQDAAEKAKQQQEQYILKDKKEE